MFNIKIHQKLAQIFSTNTIRHFLITSGGTAVNGFLGLLFYIYTARSLGPDAFGILAVAIITITLLADIADFGIDTGIIRFVGKNQNREDTLKYIKLGLEVKLVVWLTILIFGWIFAPFAADFIFLKSEFVNPLRLAMIGTGGALLFSLTSHAIQAYQKFWAWSFINIGMNGLRLLVIITLVSFGLLHLQSALFTYIAIPFAGFFMSLLLLPNFFFAEGEKSVGKELFHYSKWVALMGILTAISSRLDTLLSARLLTTAEVGIYSAASQLTIAVPQLVFALATVVAPKLSSFDNIERAKNYLKKLQLLVFGLFFLGILLIPVAVWLLPLIYGRVYQESINPFIILIIGQLIFLLSLPAHQAVFYYFAKPQLFMWTAIGQLLITGIFGWILISNLGTIGAAMTVLASNMFNFIVSAVWVIYQFKKGAKNEQEKHLGTYVS